MPSTHPRSLAANHRAASDLADHLLGVLNSFDDLRAADRDLAPSPKPPWWDGFVRSPAWHSRGARSSKAVDRSNRIDYANQQSREAIDFLIKSCERLIAPIPMRSHVHVYAACLASLRNLAAMIGPLQLGDRLHFRVIPAPWHLEGTLPETWKPQVPSAAEIRALEKLEDATLNSIASKGLREKPIRSEGKAVNAARSEYESLKSARESRNQRLEARARKQGLLTPDELAALVAKRDAWKQDIERWQLGEQDIRHLLKVLTEAPGDDGLRSAREVSATAGDSLPSMAHESPIPSLLGDPGAAALLDPVSRLLQIQTRVRALARSQPWFADAIRDSLDKYVRLATEYSHQLLANEAREKQLAKQLLAQGLLIDPAATDDTPCLHITIRGLCPAALAQELEQYPHASELPTRLRLQSAHAALATLDLEGREPAQFTTNPPAPNRKAKPAKSTSRMSCKRAQANPAPVKFTPFTWNVVVIRPADWPTPPDPCSLDRRDLEQLSESEYRTIALHHLGGLADVGSSRPIVPEPKGDKLTNLTRWTAWNARLPIAHEDRHLESPPLSPSTLPAEIAESMWREVEGWIRSEHRSDSSVAPAADTSARRQILIGDHVGRDTNDTEPECALSVNQTRVIQTLARFDGLMLMTAEAIANEMDPQQRLSARTIGETVKKLLKFKLAERPEGPRRGTRLTQAGRRLARRIAD